MKINGNRMCYERLQIEFSKEDSVDFVRITAPSKKIDTVLPFQIQDVDWYYDEEGIEHAEKRENFLYACRYTPDEIGTFLFEAFDGDKVVATEEVQIKAGTSHGYVEKSKKDARYFCYTDGTPFFWIGMNLCYPSSFAVSNGREFGCSDEKAYMGLRQYERWLKKCAQNGVNVVRLWIGHSYWSPDTEQIYCLDAVQFAKIDRIVALARQYGIHLKLTLEHFRFFDKNADPAIFRKTLHDGKSFCRSINEWLTDERWVDGWLYKVEELAKRYAGDPTVCMIELWNEMNAVHEPDKNIVIEWNRKNLARVKKLFPKQLVVNSLGSLDSELNQKIYREFCWEKSDAVQIHRYLDQGAENKICGGAIIPSIKEAFSFMATDEKPILLAETGAVNNCHSGEFKYYSCDDRGIIFVDCVYTPLFLGSAGCGNIWHWDHRYVESKNLYRYFEPLARLVKDVDFCREEFEIVDLSTEDAYVLLLKGKTVCLGFARNKKDSWYSTLRDDECVSAIPMTEFKMSAKAALTYPIWNEDHTTIRILEKSVVLEKLSYGVLFKLML